MRVPRFLLVGVLGGMLAFPAIASAQFAAPIPNPNAGSSKPTPQPAPRVVPDQPDRTVSVAARAPARKPAASAATISRSLTALVRANRVLINGAKRDLVLVQACRRYGGAEGWTCFGIDPHKLKGSIGRVTSRASERNPAKRRAWDYIRDVRKKNLFTHTRRRLDGLIDEAVKPTKGTWSQSSALKTQKLRMERLGDLGKASYIHTFFQADGLKKLRSTSGAFAVQRPIVAKAANRMVKLYNRSCQGKDRPMWPTVCWMADEQPSRFATLRTSAIANLPLAVSDGQTHRSVATRFARNRLPQLTMQVMRGWQHRKLGSMRWKDKRARTFIAENFTTSITKRQKQLGERYSPRQRAKLAWPEVSKTVSKPVCRKARGASSTWKLVGGCMSLQRSAFWSGYDKLQPEVRESGAGNRDTRAAGVVSTNEPQLFVVLTVLALMCSIALELNRRMKTKKQKRR